MLRLGRLALAAPVGCLQVYQYFMGRYSFEVDTLTGVVLYLLGKVTSDKITGHKTSSHDLKKWAAAGLMDGSFTHWWYKTVNDLTVGVADEVSRTTLMVGTTSFMYSPIYSLMFVAIMAMADGHRGKDIVNKVKSDWVVMASATTFTWLLPNVMLFTCVAPKYRLLVSMVMNYIYLIGLALWESGNLARIGSAIKSKMPFQRRPAHEGFVPAAIPALATAPAVASVPALSGGFGFSDKTIEQEWDQGLIAESLIKEVADVPLPEELPLRTPDEITIPQDASPLFNDLGVAMELNEEESNPEWDPSVPLVGFENSEPLLETQFAFDNSGLDILGMDPQPLSMEPQFDTNFETGYATAHDLTHPIMHQEEDITM
jgi:hypothetical protein